MNNSGNDNDGLQDYMDFLLSPNDEPSVVSAATLPASSDEVLLESKPVSDMSALSEQVNQATKLSGLAAAEPQRQKQLQEQDLAPAFEEPKSDSDKQKLEQALVRERVQQLALRTQQVHQEAKAERQKQQQEIELDKTTVATKLNTKALLSDEKAASLAKARAKVRDKIRQRQEQKLLASQVKAKAALAQKAQTQTKLEAQALVDVEPEPEAHLVQEVAVAPQVAESKTIAALINNRPVWAQDDFDCLFFKVSGLTLAVPLVELGSIYPLTDELTPLFAQTDWFIGLLPVDGQNLKTVNTAKVVIPERYQEDWLEKIRYVISIHGYDWGLAVDDVEQAVTINPDNVKWRGSRSKRPWLAGTIVDHMCALIDLHSLASVLEHPEQMRH